MIQFSSFNLSESQFAEVQEQIFSRLCNDPLKSPVQFQRKLVRALLEDSANHSSSVVQRLYGTTETEGYVEQYLLRAVIDGWLEAYGYQKVPLISEASASLEELRAQFDTICGGNVSLVYRARLFVYGKQMYRDLRRRFREIAEQLLSTIQSYENRKQAIQTELYQLNDELLRRRKKLIEQTQKQLDNLESETQRKREAANKILSDAHESRKEIIAKAIKKADTRVSIAEHRASVVRSEISAKRREYLAWQETSLATVSDQLERLGIEKLKLEKEVRALRASKNSAIEDIPENIINAIKSYYAPHKGEVIRSCLELKNSKISALFAGHCKLAADAFFTTPCPGWEDPLWFVQQLKETPLIKECYRLEEMYGPEARVSLINTFLKSYKPIADAITGFSKYKAWWFMPSYSREVFHEYCRYSLVRNKVNKNRKPFMTMEIGIRFSDSILFRETVNKVAIPDIADIPKDYELTAPPVNFLAPSNFATINVHPVILFLAAGGMDVLRSNAPIEWSAMYQELLST